MLIYRHLEEYLAMQLKTVQKELVVFCPFIKTKVLKRLIQNLEIDITIVTTWRKKNFIHGSSDAELFSFSKENNITLLKHPNLHMKIWVLDDENIISTSANISERALGGVEPSNREFMNSLKSMDNYDKNAFKDILKESSAVTEDDYLAVKDLKPVKIEEEPPIELKEEMNIISLDDLPRTATLEELWDNYSNDIKNDNFIHDYQLFDLLPGLTHDAFLRIIYKVLFEKEIIKALTMRLREKEMYWGEVKLWLRGQVDVSEWQNYELNDCIDVIYNWLPSLKSQYSIKKPNYSEQINYDSIIELEEKA